MESFAQQMFNEIERRCKEYQLTSGTISLSAQFDTKENEKCLTVVQQTKFSSKLNDAKDLSDNDVPEIDELKSNETDANNYRPPETIYANSNVIQRIDLNSLPCNNSVPTGRKPALPPKPPNKLKLLSKPKGFMQAVCAPLTRKSPPGKKDPAEMSLQERMALFETKKDTPAPKTSVSNKSAATTAPTTEVIISEVNQIPESTKAEISNSDSDGKIGIYGKLMAISASVDSETQNQKQNQCDTETEEKENVQSKPNHSNDVIDRTMKYESFRRSSSPKCAPPPPPSSRSAKTRDSDRVKDLNQSDSIVEYSSNRRSGEILIESHLQRYAKLNHGFGSSLYGDLTPIVTSIAPTKMRPDETIGLNDLHPNATEQLLTDSNQYQQKEDKWDRFIECLLFFCCVA